MQAGSELETHSILGFLDLKEKKNTKFEMLYIPHLINSTGFQEGQLSVTGESMCTKYWLTA